MIKINQSTVILLIIYIYIYILLLLKDSIYIYNNSFKVMGNVINVINNK